MCSNLKYSKIKLTKFSPILLDYFSIDVVCFYVMKSNLASLHIFASSSLTSNTLLLKLPFRGTVPDILTLRVSVVMPFSTSRMDFAIISACLSEYNLSVPTWIIKWSGLFSLMQSFS